MAFGLTAAQVGFAALATSVAAPLLAGNSGSNAIQQGTDAQVQANQMGVAEQRRAMEQQRADLMPYANSGGLGNNELMRRLGLGGNGRIGSFTPKTMEQLRSEMLGQFTSQQTTGGGQGLVYDPGRTVYTEYGGLEGTYGNGYKIGDLPTQTSSVIDEQGLSAAVRNAFNSQGAAREGEIDPEYGSLMRKFGQRDLDTDLVYQNGLEFGRKTGENALNQRMAAGGSYGSGAALKALTRFGNDYATTKTEGAYNRNRGEKQDIYGMLSGVSNAGQSAAAGQGAAGMSGANSIAGLYGNIGNSQAAGGIGRANAMNDGIAGATNALQWNQLINRRPQQASSGYTPSEPYPGYFSEIGM